MWLNIELAGYECISHVTSGLGIYVPTLRIDNRVRQHREIMARFILPGWIKKWSLLGKGNSEPGIQLCETNPKLRGAHLSSSSPFVDQRARMYYYYKKNGLKIYYETWQTP